MSAGASRPTTSRSSARPTRRRDAVRARTRGSSAATRAGWSIPGPALESHLDAVAAAVGARGGAGGIALTHDHADHAEGVDGLRERVGDPPVGARAGARRRRLRPVRSPWRYPGTPPTTSRSSRPRGVHGRRGARRGQRVRPPGGASLGRTWRRCGAARAGTVAVCPATGRRWRTCGPSSTSTSRTDWSASGAWSKRSRAGSPTEDELLEAAWDEAPAGLSRPRADAAGASREAARGGAGGVTRAVIPAAAARWSRRKSKIRSRSRRTTCRVGDCVDRAERRRIPHRSRTSVPPAAAANSCRCSQSRYGPEVACPRTAVGFPLLDPRGPADQAAQSQPVIDLGAGRHLDRLWRKDREPQPRWRDPLEVAGARRTRTRPRRRRHELFASSR